MSVKKPQLASAIRFALGTAIGVSATLSAAPVFAQEAGAKPVEEIYVTGSRIGRSSDFESPSPIASFNRDDLSKSGYTNLQQLMEKQPFTGNGTFSTRGNNQDSTANGAASISLRGLGADATLVLVNGRRVAISAFAESITTNFVDINSIPVAAIERIEVLKDGASAVYGSDAVAGVVNIIMRDDFEGFEVSAGGGWTTESGYDETNISAHLGHERRGFERHDHRRLLQEQHAEQLGARELRRRLAGHRQPRARGWFRPALLARLSRVLHCQRWRARRPGRTRPTAVDAKAVVDPSCPPDRTRRPGVRVRLRAVQPHHPRSGAHGPDADGPPGIRQRARGLHRDRGTAQQVAGPGRADPARRRGAVSPCRSPIRTIRSRSATDIDIGRYRTVDAGARTWHIETDNLRGVLGLRGDLNDWNWEVSAQRARSETEQSGDRSDGWVRTDFLQDADRSRQLQPVQHDRQPAVRDREHHHQPRSPRQVRPDVLRRQHRRRPLRHAGGQRADGGGSRVPR